MKSEAIILAAGRGSRMGIETAEKPKCLTKLFGKSLLEWQIESLRTAGIEKITVVRGYKADMIRGDFDVVDNVRWSDTNMVSSLFCAKESEKSVIISYADIVYSPDHIVKLDSSNHDITITADLLWEELWKLRFLSPLDDAETFRSKSSRLIEIGGKTDDIREIEAQFMGLIKLTPKGWNIMHDMFQSLPQSKKDKIDMTGMLNELLKMRINIEVVFVKGKWCESDNYDDVIKYEEQLKENNNWNHDWR